MEYKQPAEIQEILIEKFQKCKASVGVIGLGYVGLPLSLVFAEKGFEVIGFDIDASKVKTINQGLSYINILIL